MSGHLQRAWAETLADALARYGVRHVVVSPGSRSTPFVLALAEHPELRVLAVIDERAAAFVALGIGRATGRPALAVCTSGTAGAHHLPAVVEASYAGVPLLSFTANRPPELRERGASQTVDQTRLFGAHARRFVDLGGADTDPRAVDGLVAALRRAVFDTLAPTPGPVHLDAWARKPFEARGEPDETARALRDRGRRALSQLAAPVRDGRGGPSALAMATLREHLESACRVLLVAGPRDDLQSPDPHVLERACARPGVVALVEAGSGLRFAAPGSRTLDAHDPLIAAGALDGAEAPDLVVQIGATPVCGALERWIATRPDLPRVVLAGRPLDASNQAREIVVADPWTTLARALDGDVLEPGDGRWSERLAATSRRARAAVAAIVDEGAGLNELWAVRRVVEALPARSHLVLANSLPVRLVDLVACPGDLGVTTLVQRGASGIDGLVAQTAGVALASERPATLVCGDVAFAHDLGGLLALRDAGMPSTVVVLDNGGGRIFEQLPIAGDGRPERFGELFLTPPRVDVGGMARAAGVSTTRIATRHELDVALDEPTGPVDGPRVLHVVLDGDDTTRRLARVRAAVEAAVSGDSKS